MSNKPPVVVQGTVVGDPYAQTSTAQPSQTQDGNFTKGEKQETKCNDPLFALLLYGNVGAIIAVVAVYGTDAFKENTNSGNNYEGYIWATLTSGGIALILSAIGLWVMMRIPETLVKTSLIFVVVMSGVWAVLCFVWGQIAAGIFGLIFFLIGICYARAVWSRIPFATINLITACTAVKSNCGITLVAYFMVALAYGWGFLWAVAVMGVWEQTLTCETDRNGNKTCGDPNYGYLFLLFLSFFFTNEVIQNVIHVTVAGTVGTWWFVPEEGSSCCSSGVTGSLIRSMTTSFGSICFGSLIVAILQALRQLANVARQDDNGVLLCIAECILACIQSLVEYFNKWAFVYVGLYGYKYLEAGKNVFTLFRNRGWEAIIADDLVGNTLFLVSFVVGGITGAIALILEANTDWFDDAGGNAKGVAFLLGFVVGLVLASILMSVIGSGVNAVLVLFAEAPAEFQQNYPELSQKMRETWLSTYPGCM